MTDPIRALCAELAAVTERPSDEEIMELMPQQFRNVLATVSLMAASGAGTGVTPGLFRVTLNTGAIAFARAVLAHAARPAPPAPPAEGEMAELARWLRLRNPIDMEGEPDDCTYFKLTRAAELLERLAEPVPVPVSERPWERKGWCDEQGRCWFGREESDYWSANWTLGTPEEVEESCTYAPRTVCLPAHALPLPQGGEVG